MKDEIVTVDRKKFRGLTDRLEQATSIAEATERGLFTLYNDKLDDEKIANVLNAITQLLEPVKDVLYTINEGISVKNDEKVVIKWEA